MKKTSEAELKKRLGHYVAPLGLYDKTKAMSFLGKVTCNVAQLVAGSWHEIVLDYEIGASGIADGAWMKVTFKFYSDWALFQTDDPKAANYISAEYQAGPLVPGQSPATVQALKVRFDQKGHERPFQKAVIVDTVDGFLKPGDHIIIRLGDRRHGGPGTRVQTFVENNFRFRCYVDPLGTSRFAPIPGDIAVDIIPGPPARLILVGPRLVKWGQTLLLRLRAEDAWGNTCWNLGAAQADVTTNLNGKDTKTSIIALEPSGWAVAKLSDFDVDEPGELQISASCTQFPGVAPAVTYVTIDKELAVPRVYFGDLHIHSDDTVGTNDTTYNLSYGRDVAGLDVFGYTANDFNITQARWDKAVQLIEAINQDGTFVCYPGTEWCGNSCAGGDHNVVFLHGKTPEFPFDRNGEIARSFEWNENMKADTIQPGAWPLEELWATYAHDPEGHLLMPHVGGRRCNMDWHYPTLEKLVEIGSAWGQFPWLYEEVMRLGYKLGASANADEHRGRCGGGVPGAAVFGVKGGVTGIIASELTRATIGRALRARHTWATTGERLVGLTRCGEFIQGDEFNLSEDAIIEYRFLGDAGWDEITAYDHNGCIWRRNLQAELGYSQRKIRISWGGARIRDRYRWANWNGVITVTNGNINAFLGRGFEHNEEACWRINATQIGFHSDTYGDTDSIEMDVSNLARCTIRIEATIDGYVKVGNPLAGNPFAHCPVASWEISGQALLDKGSSRKDLGGADLFVSAERLTEKALPREVEGRFTVNRENGPHGHRSVFLAARQIDHTLVWTSAMFITFA